jgi:diguanylate cyclase (GGDEF)-like protein
MVYAPHLWLFFVSALVIAGLSLYAIQMRKNAVARAFLLLMLCAFVWVVGFALETAVSSLDAKILLSKIEFLAITFLPNAWLYLALSYVGQNRPRRDWFFLAILPVVTNIIIWFDPPPNWFWGNPALDTGSGPFPILCPDYQFWFYYIHAPGGYLYTLAAISVVLRNMVKAQPVYRAQSGLLLLAIFLPALTDVLYVLGYSPIRDYNFTAATFSLSGLILAWDFWGYRFLNLLPLARDTVFENLEEGIIVLDADNRIVDFNPAARELAEMSSSSLGYPIEKVRSKLLEAVSRLQAENLRHMDIAVGEMPVLVYDLRLTEICNRSGKVVGRIVALRDVTDRIHVLDQVRYLASHDSLTGVLNRAQFMELGEREIQKAVLSSGYAISVILLDMDNFKDVNDAYGHAAGDRVLTDFATECQKCLRPADIFGRMGGDEFAVVISASKQDALAIAQRLHGRIRELRFETGNGQISLTMSLGIVSSDEYKQDLQLEKMLGLADQALYRAKQAGKDGIVVQG